MEKTKKGIKPPINKKPEIQVLEKEQPAPQSPTIASTAVGPYKSAVDRMAALPTVSEHLTAERIQGLFAHLLMLSLNELMELEKSKNLSTLERQVIRLIVKSFRELPQKNIPLKDDKGNPKLDPKTNQPMFKVILHPDALASDKLSLDIMKYLHERAFGKAKATIALVGADGGPLQVQSAMVLGAMQNLPAGVVAMLSGQTQKNKAKKV